MCTRVPSGGRLGKQNYNVTDVTEKRPPIRSLLVVQNRQMHEAFSRRVAVAALLLATTPAAASATAAVAPPPPPSASPTVGALLDKDKDGKISKTEYASLDANRDGKVTRAEAADFDRDGKVEKREKERADSNKDGKVTRHEVLSTPAKGKPNLSPPPRPKGSAAPPQPPRPPRSSWGHGLWDTWEDLIDEFVLIITCALSLVALQRGARRKLELRRNGQPGGFFFAPKYEGVSKKGLGLDAYGPDPGLELANAEDDAAAARLGKPVKSVEEMEAAVLEEDGDAPEPDTGAPAQRLNDGPLLGR